MEDSEQSVKKKKRVSTVHTGSDPSRPPSWRYARVKYLLSKKADTQVLIDGVDDPATRHFFLFCQLLEKTKTPEERLALRVKHPGILEALQLRKYAQLDALGLFEGFLCTNANLAWVSDRFSFAPATVAWYEHLFFDVWTRRDATFWVESEVLKPPEYEGHGLTAGGLSKALAPLEIRQQWERACAYRKFGYHGGVVALELLATGFLSTDAKPTYKELADTFIKKGLETAISNEGVIMMNARRKLNKTEGEFIKLALELAERSLLAGSVDIVQGVQKALSLVAPLIGDDVKDELAKLAAEDSNKAALLVHAAELRHVEQTRLHLGLELSPEARELVTSFDTRRETEQA
jgi:hypothetical protein